MPRPYVLYPDRRLSTPAAQVPGIDDDVRALWDEMLEAMYAMPGLGLAAPQLGVPLRVIVVDAGHERKPLRLANPVVSDASDETITLREGSPNLPGLWADVTRAAHVVLSGDGPDGPQKHRLGGLWAASAQHQVDHLEGRLFIDRLGPVKRRMLLDRHRKARRKRA